MVEVQRWKVHQNASDEPVRRACRQKTTEKHKQRKSGKETRQLLKVQASKEENSNVEKLKKLKIALGIA